MKNMLHDTEIGGVIYGWVCQALSIIKNHFQLLLKFC